MTKYIIALGIMVALGVGGVMWYRHRKGQKAAEIRMQNPGATPEQVEVLADLAMDKYLADVRQHLSGASQVQFDRLVSQVKDLAAKAQAKAKTVVAAVTPAKAEGEPAKS